jgi:hypothetical protein
MSTPSTLMATPEVIQQCAQHVQPGARADNIVVGLLRRAILVDGTVRSLTVPTQLPKLVSIIENASSFEEAGSLMRQFFTPEYNSKLRHYHNLARTAVRDAGHSDSLEALLCFQDPLRLFDISLIPCVATPWGNLDLGFERLLRLFANKSAEIYTLQFSGCSNIPQSYFRMKRIEMLHTFRSWIAVRLANAGGSYNNASFLLETATASRPRASAGLPHIPTMGNRSSHRTRKPPPGRANVSQRSSAQPITSLPGRGVDHSTHSRPPSSGCRLPMRVSPFRPLPLSSRDT